MRRHVPVFDIKNLMFKHPVLSTAIVGYPDPRLGERACAFVVLRPGQTFDLSDVQALMAEHRVAKQYWPERVEIVADLPKTPAGKVQKYQLRELAKAFADAPHKASACVDGSGIAPASRSRAAHPCDAGSGVWQRYACRLSAPLDPLYLGRRSIASI
ncbi:AMP-binding enzyme [Bradyrhizobium sp. AZCC 2230]|uniref:AMP-binding enzyme n=1 Tax=Bradyrhizobium sp. AZCC 2230 TaxID=3117021 RepID=UPI002FF009E1